ncbi:MAG: HNH endonuclease [Ilumatobacteraceae bacterium]
MDGTPLSPDEVFAASVVGTVRRVVMDAASVVIDLGRKRRVTGAARAALLLQNQTCVFAGCTTKSMYGQGDHTMEHSKGGATNPANGDILCPHHNRFKNRGFRVARGPDGHWHTYRPDGTEIGRPPD